MKGSERPIATRLSELTTRVVIVVPESERRNTSWTPGGGNLFFELVASAKERYGENAVDTFVVDGEAQGTSWHGALERHLVNAKATHCVAFAECDPAQAGPWHWQYFAAGARRSWNGAFVGILTDGLYLLHQARAARFRHAYPNSSFVAIDIDASRVAGFVPERTIFGPCFLPISETSVRALAETSSDTVSHPEFDVVFVGQVYPNREGFLESLRSSGLRVGVNPHRTDPAVRTGFAQYIGGLRRGHFTVNLSEAGGFPAPQLKSRMLEGPLFGTIVCSDESELAGNFFDASEFIYFDSVERLTASILRRLADAQALATMREAAMARAKAIASSAFWSTVERALVKNSLPLPLPGH